MIIYGIKNCDTMKKAFKWLDEQGIDYQFHDYKKEGLNEALAKQWLEELGYEQLINKRGTTWRKLDDTVKNNLTNETALSLMLENSSIIKRPLLDTGNQRYLGFKPELYDTIFKPL